MTVARNLGRFTTGWSIRRFVKTARRYRTIQIQAGDHVVTAADPLPEDLATAIESVKREPVRTNLSQFRCDDPAGCT
jgi:hypothetical protein